MISVGGVHGLQGCVEYYELQRGRTAFYYKDLSLSLSFLFSLYVSLSLSSYTYIYIYVHASPDARREMKNIPENIILVVGARKI